MEDARIELVNKLGRILDENRHNRDDLWTIYWEGRRMVTVPEKAPAIIQKLADDLGGKINYVSPPLPDGSGFATMSFPLPKDHWIYAKGFNVPPMPFRKGTDNPDREVWMEKVRAVAQYAVRASTMNGKETDFDPDAMVQNFVTGMLGYHTPDGLSSNDWANPPEDAMKQNPLIRPFESFPNLAPKPAPQDATDRYVMNGAVITVIRDCIARLKSAREKESMKQNLGSLFAVIIKVQKDLESLVGESRDWQRDDANVEKHVALDDRHSAEAL